ncbi:hypothetical protein D3C78_1398120 [compost metagenome]
MNFLGIDLQQYEVHRSLQTLPVRWQPAHYAGIALDCQEIIPGKNQRWIQTGRTAGDGLEVLLGYPLSFLLYIHSDKRFVLCHIQGHDELLIYPETSLGHRDQVIWRTARHYVPGSAGAAICMASPTTENSMKRRGVMPPDCHPDG